MICIVIAQSFMLLLFSAAAAAAASASGSAAAASKDQQETRTPSARVPFLYLFYLLYVVFHYRKTPVGSGSLISYAKDSAEDTRAHTFYRFFMVPSTHTHTQTKGHTEAIFGASLDVTIYFSALRRLRRPGIKGDNSEN